MIFSYKEGDYARSKPITRVEFGVLEQDEIKVINTAMVSTVRSAKAFVTTL